MLEKSLFTIAGAGIFMFNNGSAQAMTLATNTLPNPINVNDQSLEVTFVQDLDGFTLYTQFLDDGFSSFANTADEAVDIARAIRDTLPSGFDVEPGEDLQGIVGSQTWGFLVPYGEAVTGLNGFSSIQSIRITPGSIADQDLSSGTNLAWVFVGETATIPTPALIPGLIGMGAAVLRKRKQEIESEV